MRWSEPLTGAKITFDDFNIETQSSIRSRQRSLSSVSLDDATVARGSRVFGGVVRPHVGAAARDRFNHW